MPRGLSFYDEARLQGRLWTPRVLSPALLSFWYDTSDKSAVGRSSAGITQLFDKSGRGNHLTPNTGNPAFSEIALGRAAPGIIFTSTSVGLTRTSGVSVGNPGTTYIVSQVANTGETRLVSLASNGPDYNYVIPIIYNSSSLRAFGPPGSFAGTSGTVPLNTPFIGGSNFSTTQSVVDLNGTAGTSVALTYPTATATAIGLGIGAGTENSGGNNHVISEALMPSIYVPPSLQLGEIIKGYLAHKWANLGAYTLLRDLSPTHRFKNRPPLIGD